MKKENIRIIATSYYKLLYSIDWDDNIMVNGLKEGLNKFLSNAILSLSTESKYLQGDYYSAEAITKINNKDFTNLVYEHMVPKNKYIQKICQDKAKDKTLDIVFIVDLLNKYWKIAVITKDEDKQLISRSMPENWDKENIFLRYQEVKIQLIFNPFLSNEEIWETGLIFIDKNSESNLIYNTNGTSGTLEFKNQQFIIKADTREFVYQNNEELRNLLYDGWIIE
ncbi:MAG: hypothetical protein M0P94_03230 [Candidatus Absconditabacterales bacterium]|nr:hypothetical protein [Candidatus Absconditabacterales bacterium]